MEATWGRKNKKSKLEKKKKKKINSNAVDRHDGEEDALMCMFRAILYE